MPLVVLAGSQAALASTRTVVLIGSIVASAAICLYLVLSWRILTGWAALAFTSVTAIFFWHWNGAASVGVLGGWGAFFMYVLVAAAAIKYSAHRYLKVGVLAAAVTLSATLGAVAMVKTLTAPDGVMKVQTPVGEVSLTSRPDIVLVVLDGYARADVLREFYDFDNRPFLDDLRARGFEIADNSIANYTITHMSLPALLNMSYMHPDGAVIGKGDLDYLADEVSGANDLVETLKDEGYRYVHGASDHWLNTCGPQVDQCLTGPPLDITGHALLSSTPIADLFYGETGDPSTHLNLERISFLEGWRDDDPANPAFTFLHLQLPHPPMFLDSRCALRVEPDLWGRNLAHPGISEEELEARKDAWLEQVECANRTMASFVERVDDETVIVLVSDHGPDSRFMFHPTPTPEAISNLTPDQQWERMSTLTAVRLPKSCRGTLPDDVDTVNTFRVVLSCLSGEPINDLPTRSYVAGFNGPILELKLQSHDAD